MSFIYPLLRLHCRCRSLLHLRLHPLLHRKYYFHKCRESPGRWEMSYPPGLEPFLLSSGHIRSTKVRIVLLNCSIQKLMTGTAFKISLQEPVSVWLISKSRRQGTPSIGVCSLRSRVSATERLKALRRGYPVIRICWCRADAAGWLGDIERTRNWMRMLLWGSHIVWTYVLSRSMIYAYPFMAGPFNPKLVTLEFFHNFTLSHYHTTISSLRYTQ